ncbi:MAG: hypothetical protein V7L26_33585, partial [Nostoc sp.]
SCGGVTITTLKQYIESQDRPEDGNSSPTNITRPIRKLTSQYLQGFETIPCRFCFNEEIRV